jgi:hypothetical protein
MAINPRDIRQQVQREETNEAFDVAESIENPRIAPRVIPVIIMLIIGLTLLAILFFLQR